MKRPAATKRGDIMLRQFAAQDRRKESRPATDYVGIAPHKNPSQVCILTEGGEMIERRIKTDRGSFDKLCDGRAAAHTLVQVEPPLVVLKALNEQIKAAHRRIEESAKADEVVQRLCRVPGVGPVVATTFASTLDGASRFLGPSTCVPTSAGAARV